MIQFLEVCGSQSFEVDSRLEEKKSELVKNLDLGGVDFLRST